MQTLLTTAAIALSGLALVPSASADPNLADSCVIGFFACWCLEDLGGGPCIDRQGADCPVLVTVTGESTQTGICHPGDGADPVDQTGTCVIGYGACFCLAELGPCLDHDGRSCVAAVGLNEQKTGVGC